MDFYTFMGRCENSRNIHNMELLRKLVKDSIWMELRSDFKFLTKNIHVFTRKFKF